MTHTMRALAMMVLAALALASAGEAGRESHLSKSLWRTASSAVLGDGAHRHDLLASVDHPIQPATARSVVSASSFIAAITGLETDTRAPGLTSLSVQAPAVVGSAYVSDQVPTVRPAAGVRYRDILSRTGAVSAFATSLPPPPLA